MHYLSILVSKVHHNSFTQANIHINNTHTHIHTCMQVQKVEDLRLSVSD